MQRCTSPGGAPFDTITCRVLLSVLGLDGLTVSRVTALRRWALARIHRFLAELCRRHTSSSDGRADALGRKAK